MTSNALLPENNIRGSMATQLEAADLTSTTSKKQRATVDPEPVLLYSPQPQEDTTALDGDNAAKDEDRQVGDCD